MITVNLEFLLSQYPEDEIKSFINRFRCPKNKDLEHFLHHAAIDFSKRNVSKTYLIIDDTPNILAYFSLAFTSLQLTPFKLSKSLISQMDGFNKDAKEVKVHLIGQIGKNFALKDNTINLELILQETFTIIKEIRSMAGGRFAILECNPDEALISLYETYGFKRLYTQQDEDNLVTMCIKVPD